MRQKWNSLNYASWTVRESMLDIVQAFNFNVSGFLVIIFGKAIIRADRSRKKRNGLTFLCCENIERKGTENENKAKSSVCIASAVIGEKGSHYHSITARLKNSSKIMKLFIQKSINLATHFFCGFAWAHTPAEAIKIPRDREQEQSDEFGTECEIECGLTLSDFFFTFSLFILIEKGFSNW